jgi:hypothetical protein
MIEHVVAICDITLFELRVRVTINPNSDIGNILAIQHLQSSQKCILWFAIFTSNVFGGPHLSKLKLLAMGDLHIFAKKCKYCGYQAPKQITTLNVYLLF